MRAGVGLMRDNELKNGRMTSETMVVEEAVAEG